MTLAVQRCAESKAVPLGSQRERSHCRVGAVFWAHILPPTTRRANPWELLPLHTANPIHCLCAAAYRYLLATQWSCVAKPYAAVQVPSATALCSLR